MTVPTIHDYLAALHRTGSLAEARAEMASGRAAPSPRAAAAAPAPPPREAQPRQGQQVLL